MGLPDGELFTIVGVVGNIRRNSLESAFARQMWLPASSRWYPPRQLVVRTSVPAASLTEAIKGRIREIDPNLPVSRIQTMASIKRAGLADRRFSMLLLMTYGLVGLSLCAVGIYGLLAQTVGQRTREIGIRMALGARRSDVVRHVVLGVALTVLAGCVAGAAGAVLLARFVEHMLFGIRPTEPAVYAGVLGIVLLVTFVAACLPARRATRIDPLEAIRAE
jgi:predicted lysophospholipase L1 biosynthesis ABC-type transport system permease subunit